MVQSLFGGSLCFQFPYFFLPQNYFSVADITVVAVVVVAVVAAVVAVVAAVVAAVVVVVVVAGVVDVAADVVVFVDIASKYPRQRSFGDDRQK